MSGPATSDMRPGRRVTIKYVAFDGFPADNGLWWLRWMDHGATSRSSLLHPLFSRLPDGTRGDTLPSFLDTDLVTRPSASHRAKAHVGWLPVLRIGMVVQAGTVIGELGAKVRRSRTRRRPSGPSRPLPTRAAVAHTDDADRGACDESAF